jgi:hypothetical protein
MNSYVLYDGSTMNSYVLFEVDPTYKTESVIAVFNNEDDAFNARKIATQCIHEEADDRGVYYKITAFQTNKLYSL